MPANGTDTGRGGWRAADIDAIDGIDPDRTGAGHGRTRRRLPMRCDR